MDVESLYLLITEAIRRAETLDDLRAPGMHSAYLDVSLLEEKVTNLLPASDPEGALARRGAVRAALAAEELTRAQQLVERFLAEDDAENELRTELHRLLEQAEPSLAARSPYLAASAGKKAPMIRLIKRYESRKLYDTEESRYVSLDEISGWIRQGKEVRVIDNASGADVTSQTLSEIIFDEGRHGTSFLSSELLHDLVRMGERAVSSGFEQTSNGVDRLVQASINRLGPVRRVREQMSSLRARLEQLESSLAELERGQGAEPNAGSTEGTNASPPKRELRKN